MNNERTSQGFGKAWLCLTAALAVHVADEALTDFLSLYNPTVRTIKEHLPWLPLPVFTFRLWLAGLVAGVLVLLLLAKPAFANSRILRPFAYFFAVAMFGNGLLHIAASVHLGRFAPGVTSAPLLLAASAYLLLSLKNEPQEVRSTAIEQCKRLIESS